MRSQAALCWNNSSWKWPIRVRLLWFAFPIDVPQGNPIIPRTSMEWHGHRLPPLNSASVRHPTRVHPARNAHLATTVCPPSLANCWVLASPANVTAIPGVAIRSRAFALTASTTPRANIANIAARDSTGMPAREVRRLVFGSIANIPIY